jgi:predicted ATPase/class 3 adenylate cyclase
VRAGQSSRGDLPTGTVTFLFTDIEGSTRLLQRLGDRYPETLESHKTLLREAFRAHGGVEVDTEGDAFFVAFLSASQALAAAVKAQRALEGHPWPAGAQVRVRMGLHTGEAVRGADGYVGLDVHRAARIAGAGHGGQVLLSETTRALVELALPAGVTLRDLGEHHLRDLEHPERLSQVIVEGLEADFPPVRSAERRLGNLPTVLTTFVGRHRELRELKGLLARSRLVTLTGPGGTGKTRLALQAAADLQPGLEDGAFFVGLAPISDPDLMIPTLAHALQLPEDPARTPMEVVTQNLDGKELLLVLDNFEQVLPAAPRVADVLGATQRVRVVVTSREPLGLSGEREYPVEPMTVPDPQRLPSLDRLVENEAVSLFVDRATAVKPDFELTKESAPGVAEICARLDGLPLAIELAAARVKILSPQAMLGRLEDRLALLTGSRDAPARQRTLRDTLAWSYELLEERERTLLTRLSVFVGGFTLDAAEAVCGGGLGDTFEGVASLVNKSLLRQMDTGGGEPRFLMLETIREYAAGLLTEDDAEAIERWHAEHFVALAEEAESELTGERQGSFLDILAADHDNLRAALDRSAGRGWIEIALRTGAALWRFWQMRGHLREGVQRMGAVLSLPGVANHPQARIKAVWAAGSLSYWMADFAEAAEWYEKSLALSRELGDGAAVAESLYNLSFALSVPRTDLPRARGLLEESLALFRELGDPGGVAKVSWALAGLEYDLEEYDAAETHGTDALAVFRELGDRFQTGWALHLLGITAIRLGRLDVAWVRLSEGLRLFREAADVSAIVLLLADFVELALAEGDPERSLRCGGAEAALRESTGVGLSGWIRPLEERRKLAEQLTSQATAARAWAEGSSMSLDEAVEYALSQAPATAQ